MGEFFEIPSKTALTGEEELSIQVIDQIRDWLNQEEEAKGERSIPRLAIKFCGGCNPTIDRGFLARAIREGLSEAVYWVPWEEESDLVVIINGCLTACADQKEVLQKSAASLAIQGNTVSAIERNQSP